jgi:hypothetical protein
VVKALSSTGFNGSSSLEQLLSVIVKRNKKATLNKFLIFIVFIVFIVFKKGIIQQNILFINNYTKNSIFKSNIVVVKKRQYS